MTRTILPIALLAASAACTVNNDKADNGDNAIVISNEAPTDASVDPAPEPLPSNDAQPTPDVLKQPAAAVAALQSYCDAIAKKDYASAYALWGDDGKASGMTLEQFKSSLAKYDAFDCDISDPLDAQGAAGSSYLTVPIRVNGTLAKGGGFSLQGDITMRRVNDVPGSSEASRRWHIAQSGLKPRP